MAQLKDTTITGGLSVSNTVNITGATQHNADVTLYSSSGDSPSLIFQRGTYADNLNDYKITDVGGYLKIKQQGNSSTSGFTQVAELTNQGTFTVSTPPTTDTTPSVTAWISPTDSAIKISTDVDIASGDKLVIRDSSDSNKLRSSSITFGTSTTTYLRNDGTWGTPSGGGGGGSYTATSPIDITSDVISHEDSGVTAGTYVTQYDSKSGGVILPSLTVDSKGHITSGSSYGYYLYNANSASMETFASGLMTYAESVNLRGLDLYYPHIYSDSSGYPFSISAGSSSKAVSMSVGYNQIANTSIAYTGNKVLAVSSSYAAYNVIGVEAYLQNTSTSNREPVIVDWTSTSITWNSSTSTYDCTVTVSTANNVPTGYTLYFKILYSPYLIM